MRYNFDELCFRYVITGILVLLAIPVLPFLLLFILTGWLVVKITGYDVFSK